MATDGEVQVPDVISANTVYHESTVTSIPRPNQHIPAWTTDASLPGDRGHRNSSKSAGAECTCPLLSAEPTGRFLRVTTDALNSQTLAGHTGKAPLTSPASRAERPLPKHEGPSALPCR